MTDTTTATVNALAILKYKGAPDHTVEEPTSTRSCPSDTCKVLNCKTLEEEIHEDYSIKCVYIDEMRSSGEEDDRESVPMFGDSFTRDKEIFLTLSRLFLFS